MRPRTVPGVGRVGPVTLPTMVLVAVLTLGGCGVADGDVERHRVEAATCASILARAGKPADAVRAERFAEALAEFRNNDRPYSTIEPFLRACRSFG